MADLVFTDLNVATMRPDRDGYGALRDAAIAVDDGRITWVGPATDASATDASAADEVVSLGGRWVTPGLIDCHTHLLFGGNRAAEFEQRLAGATYEEIAAAGGGILATVEATRRAGDGELAEGASRRARWLCRHGATTIEVKSGYGLDLETELRMLRIARRLSDRVPASIVTTLLGAHTVPPEFRADRTGYVDLVCDEMIPQALTLGLADAVDVFCESVGFTLPETERILDAAVAAGLPVKAHAGQLSDLGAPAAAAARGALSVDHLEHLSKAGIAALASAGTVAVLLPGASYLLDEDARPPVDELRDADVPIAISTDLNPGTSPLAALPLACSLAANRFGLTPVECLAGVTRHAATALGLDDRGIVAPGMRADLAVWDIEGPEELTYWVGADLCHATVRAGKPTFWEAGPTSQETVG